MPRKSLKPCPMCRREIEHKAGDVCAGCRNRWSELMVIRERLGKQAGEKEAYFLPLEETPLVWSGNFITPKYMTKALCDMLLAITPVALETHFDTTHCLPEHQTWHTRGEARLLTPAAAETIRVFFKALKQALDETYAAGEAAGKNLLGALARGTITLDELNSENTGSTLAAISTGKK